MAMAIFLTLPSCQQEDDSLKTSVNQYELTEVKTDNYVPTSIFIQDNVARIGFIESAQFYYLNLNWLDNQKFLPILKEAKEKHIPLRVTSYINTADIAEVSMSSGKEMEEYKKSLIPAVELRSNCRSYISGTDELYRLFDKLSASSDINFNFILYGCEAKAHRMAQLLNEEGYACKKIFIFCHGKRNYTLRATKKNNRKCCAEWQYHVAVLVTVRDVVYDPCQEIYLDGDYVIDPSVSYLPLPIMAWKNYCTNKSCNLGSEGTTITHERIVTSDVYVAGKTLEEPNEYDDKNSTRMWYTLDYISKQNSRCSVTLD